MIEAIVRQELLLGGRRARLHLFRWAYAGWLIVQVCYFWALFSWSERARENVLRMQNPTALFVAGSPTSAVGAWFCETFVVQQMILLALAVPPLVCGAIADEKRRGTLIYLLTTDLDTRHILLGKLIGRSVQVLALMAAGLPLFALFAGFAGIHALPLLLLGLALIPPVFALAAAALLASVVCRQTRDAVLALYVVGAVGYGLTWLVPGLTQAFDPRWIVSPVWGQRGEEALALAGQRLLVSLGLWTALGLGCLGLALAWLRPLFRRELEQATPGPATWYAGDRPVVSKAPVAWREQHVEGLSPFPVFKRVPLWLACALIALATTLSSLLILVLSMPAGGATAGDFLRAALRLDLARLGQLLPAADLGFLVQSIVVLLLAAFVVGVRASGTVTGEREKSTWEAVLMTPLSEKDLVHGKLWGILSSAAWYLLAYAAPALALSILGGLLAFLWTLLWLAVTLLAIYYVGAAGIWASVRSSSSWRALLVTLGFGYLGGVVLFLVEWPILYVLAYVLLAFLSVLDVILQAPLTAAAQGLSAYMTQFFVATCLGLAAVFFFAARLFLSNAQKWIALRDRTRHWDDDDEVVYRRSRRGTSPRSLEAQFGE